MALLGVPWAIDGGAMHSATVGRIVSYIAGSGTTGIVLPNDLYVKQVATATGAVLVGPGAANIVSNYTGAKSQSYVVMNDAEVQVPVPANTTGSTVTRYLIIRLYDPQFPLQPAPPSVPNGPYNFFEVVSSITALGFPYIVLCKFSIPGNTSAITTAYITDMREMCNPRSKTVTRTRPHVVNDGAAGLLLSSTAADGEWFPNQGGEQYIDIPFWATRMHIRAEWLSVLYGPEGSTGWGDFWVDFGPMISAQKLTYRTESFRWDMPAGDFSRGTWTCVADMEVPLSLRGDAGVQFIMKAREAGGNAAVKMDERSGVAWQIIFSEVPYIVSST